MTSSVATNPRRRHNLVLHIVLIAAVPCCLSVRASADPVATPYATAEVFILSPTEGDNAPTLDPAALQYTIGLNGRWHHAPKTAVEEGDSPLSDEQREAIERLKSIGYVSGSEGHSGATGVVQYDPERADNGTNFYYSGHESAAYLIDMKGKVLHEWHYDVKDAFPGDAEYRNICSYWRRAQLFENGDVIAQHVGKGIIKIDKNSKLIWAARCEAHHDFQVMDDGTIYTLTHEAHLVPRINATKPILEDFIQRIDADGNVLERISLLECFEQSDYGMLMADRPQAGDIFHTNTLEYLDGSVPISVEGFRKGNFLTSMLMINTIAVVDPTAGKVVWATKGEFRRQHDPTLLPNGRILLFDNQGLPGESRALDYDPALAKIRWSYRGTRERPCLSMSCGLAQRLPNGNTLITESDSGRALEVTWEGDIVWEFYNPHFAGENNEFIATLFDVHRLPEKFKTRWAKKK